MFGSCAAWGQLVGEGTDVSLRIEPSWGEQGLPSDPSWAGSMVHAEVSVEILSTMLDRQSKLEMTALLSFFAPTVTKRQFCQKIPFNLTLL